MLNKTFNLKSINNELEQYIQTNCPISADGKPEYIGEGCDNAFDLLAETARNITLRELEKK